VLHAVFAHSPKLQAAGAIVDVDRVAGVTIVEWVRRGLLCAMAVVAAVAAGVVAPGAAGASSTAGTGASPAGAGASTAGAGASTAGAGASTAGAQTPGEMALQVKAEELAGQIQAAGLAVDQLDQAYDAALVHRQQLAGQLAGATAAVAKSLGELATARRVLVAQAVMAYVTGETPLQRFQSGLAGYDPSLTVAYGEAIAAGQRQAVSSYKAAIAAARADQQLLLAAQKDLASTLAQITADREAGMRALAAKQAALAQVHGQLAVLVAQVQAEQQAAVKAALAAQQNVPPAAPATVSPSDPQADAPASPTTTPAPASSNPENGTPPASSPTSAPAPVPAAGANQPAPGWKKAVDFAYAQLGKPYQWGGTGPNSYDCSGLTMMSWEAAGVQIPRVAQDQYDATARVPIADLLPGDLVFFGTSGSGISHVGIYIGNGEMIDAPETGQDVSIQSIYWPDLAGGGRVQG
jgi:cell wall-associated NlpC family hydrolase